MESKKKKPSTFSLAPDVLQLLPLLAKAHDRSMSSTLDQLVREDAEKRGIKLPAPQ